MIEFRAGNIDSLSIREFHDIVKLRIDVFVVEQECAYPELDGRDIEPETIHIQGFADGELACYARVLVAGPNKNQIGRVIVAPAFRKYGYGRDLLREALKHCSKDEIFLEAQTHLQKFYGSVGFKASADAFEYMEDGIPHIHMDYIG